MATISLDLPSSIVYVAGQVNGVVTVFNQDDLTGTWRAYVDASENDLYHIDLEIYDEAGNVGYYDQVISYILPVFVYDRTQDDVDRVYALRRIGWANLTEEQRAEWMRGLKGCLNKSDLKRVENDIHVIAQLLGMDIHSNKDNIPDIPDDLYFVTLLTNVTKLMESGYRYQNTPKLPTVPLTTYQKWNDIEHILHDIYVIYMDSAASYDYAGEIYAGDINLI